MQQASSSTPTATPNKQHQVLPKHIDAIFLDLDGTLLGYQDETMGEVLYPLYAKHFPSYTKEYGIAFQQGVVYMLQQTSAKPQHANIWLAFADKMKELLNMNEETCKLHFTQAFESEGYNKLRERAKLYTEVTAKLMKIAHERNIKLVLATNPIFPKIAIERRLKWSGAQPEDFVCITHSENMHCTKSVAYYQHLLEQVVQCKAENTIMVGNDNKYDMIASELGINTWLIDEWERSERKYKIDNVGSLEAFVQALEANCKK